MKGAAVLAPLGAFGFISFEWGSILDEFWYGY
jgi:hypothetical protein